MSGTKDRNFLHERDILKRFEGFSRAEAVYGTDAVGADWSEQAAKKAEQYLRYSAFSRSSLIDQLEFEGFTRAQAEYGVRMVGY